MEALLTHSVGFAASAIAFILWLPQARKVWSLRNDHLALRGIATGTQWLVVVNALLWFAYGYLESAFWIAAPGFINLPLALMTVYIIRRARNRDQFVYVNQHQEKT